MTASFTPPPPLNDKADRLAKIESHCELFELESANLDAMIGELEADLESVKQKHLKNIKKQATAVARAQAELHSLVEQSPDLFVKPRTVTVHGVKVGYSVSAGTLEFEDEETVIALIKKHHKGEASLYIKTIEKVKKDALKTLSAEELAKIGCCINGAGDVVLLKRVAGDVEKLIDKLIGRLVEAMVDMEDEP